MTVDRPDSDTDSVDEQVLVLRGQGRSFRRIADTLGLGKASEANRAFNRALRRHSPDKRASIRSQENARLDHMAASVRADESLSTADADKRLRVVERLRTRLMSD